jgi:hypothetical protein
VTACSVCRSTRNVEPDPLSGDPRCLDCFWQPPIELKEGIEVSAPRCPDGSMGALWRTGDADGGTVGADRTAICARRLGIPTLNEAFPCVPRGHDHTAHMHPTAHGFWAYRCEGADRSYGLGEVRAFLAYGQVRRITAVEAARWRERLEHEAGLREMRALSALPPNLSSTARVVGEGWRTLVGLRDRRWGDEPFIFARGFVIPWCGVTKDQARHGVGALERVGVIVRAGTHRIGPYEAILWRPGSEFRP